MPTTLDQPSIDDDAQKVSTAVIRAIADTSAIAPTELPPIYEAIDPDALERLFQRQMNGVPRRGGTVEFDYAGYSVRISFDRTLDVTVSSVAD